MRTIEIEKVKETVEQLIDSNKELLNTIEFVIGMSRGGLIPAVMVATKLNVPLVTIYIDKKDNIYLDRVEWIKDRRCLLVDDICRTGNTIKLSVDKIMEDACPESIFTMTLFDVSSFSKKSKPDLSCEIDQDVCLPWDFDRK